MRALDSFLSGTWFSSGSSSESGPVTLVNPATEAPLATVSPAQNLAAAVTYAREHGGPALRRLRWRERGALLTQLSQELHRHREELLDLAVASGGNTRGDAKFDVDGGLGVLAAYAELAASLPDEPWLRVDEPASLVRTSKIRAQHVLVARHGVAVHINAFNFPAWGLLGKAAVALLAGMPVLCKPATATSAVAHRIAEIIAPLVPAGAFQLLMGPAQDLLDHLGPQDVIAFTGSADTGAKLGAHACVRQRGTRLNIEADSLNAVVLGPDVSEGSELWNLAVRDAVIELTQKAGQKCTATRRILVPAEQLDGLRDAVVERLQALASRIGDPSDKSVKMGPLASAQQLSEARRGIAHLAQHARIVFGNPERRGFVGVNDGQGYFLEPVVLQATPEAALDRSSHFHSHEVFGPVTTMLPYDGSIDQAAQIVGFGGGSLVTTVYSDDRGFCARAITEVGPHLGRLVLGDERSAAGAFSPGCVFPQANHGGPGRAGGGAELGGRLGLELYTQRLAIQAGASQLARLLGTTKVAE